MEAAPVHIIQYFDGSKQGVIPLFQRPYSWDTTEWATLWDDVMAQYEGEDRSSHFMGALVTVPVKSVPVGVTKHLVIDGQQRLTTLSILLVAIRHMADKAGDTSTSGIIGDLLVNRHYKAPDDLKLVPTQADRAAYNALIYQKDVDSHHESRVCQAFKFFLKKLRGLDPDDRDLDPAKTFQAIKQSLQVVMINLGEADDPYLIFESLNHKGKPLNQADLVRNYALMRFQHSTTVGGEQEGVYEDLWRPMETGLDSSMTEFLRHFGMRNGRNVRKGDIYSASKAEFEKLKKADDVRVMLGEMKLAALAYQKFIKPAEEGNDRIASRLRGIQELDSTVAYPLLMRLYRGWQRETISLDDLVHCLDILESYFVRRLVCAVPTNGLNKMTLELCSSMSEENAAVWLRDRLLQSSGGRRWPTDQEFTEALVTQRLYPRHRLAKYLLVALEEAHDHKEPVETSAATMEHIMPQTLTEQWQIRLGADYEDIHDRWSDTLGNLTLTGYNSELGNGLFEEKKSKLRNTHFELSRPLLELSVWDATEIEFRAKKLSAMALRRWNRD